MDREDRRRYFVIGSVIVEVVQPILRTKLENEYTGKGFTTFQDFLGSQPVLHTLYHLRHKGLICCTDSVNCPRNRGSLPLNYYQWDLMYAENPGNHHCHCRYSAKSVQLSDLDITLSSLILLNCFPLSNIDKRTIENLRTLKNNYLSHNTKGAIKEPEYRTIWTDLSLYILHLDSTKQDYLIRIEQRPLDVDLCHKYNAELLGMHQKLDEIGSSINGIGETITTVDSNVREILNIVYTMQKPSVEQRSIGTEVDVSHVRSIDRIGEHNLGQNIFSLHREIDLSGFIVTDIVMMDNGKVVMCLYRDSMLLIYDTEGLQENRIKCHEQPWDITAVNSHIVAVIDGFEHNSDIVFYDINSKVALKSFRIPGIAGFPFVGISMVDNHLVVTGINKLLVVDCNTEKTVRTIHTNHQPWRVDGAGGKMFSNSVSYDNTNDNLYCYSIAGKLLFTITLPSHPSSMTLLNDGSLYVGSEDGLVRHISPDGRKYKTVENIRAKRGDQIVLSYNQKQDKLCITSWNRQSGDSLKVYHKT